MLKKRKIKFGKSSKDVDKIKSDFFSLNFKLLKNQNKINEFYRSQPKRQKCKACERKLIGDYFINHKIKYIQCKYCSHINGWHQDNKRFSNKIYVDEKVKYFKKYFENNIKKYKLRQKKIYNPKAEFLKSIFQNNSKIKVLDNGAGSGYFVSSLIDKKFKSAKGIEISKNQTNFGKKMFKLLNKNPNKLKNSTYENLKKEIEVTDYNCISLIGVIEHLVDMSDLMKSIKKNKKIKYLYVLVPMFSLICTIENIFADVFNRHLGGGHTHLFTEKSLKRFMLRFGFKEHSSWWFGTDMDDLFRSFIIQMKNKKFKPLEKISLESKRLIDSLQIQLDQKKLCSEVHMLLKR